MCVAVGNHAKLCQQPRMDELDRTMSERGDDLRHLKDKMNRVEDEVFADFCTMIGVPNIR